MKEFEYIKEIKSLVNLKNKKIIKGIGDDCAVIEESKTNYRLITTDSIVEDVHFSCKYYDPLEIAYKACAVNISDICSMGGVPTIAVVNMGLPAKKNKEFVRTLYKGITAYMNNYGVDIVGGDTVSSDKLFISITLEGTVKKKELMMRSGAKTGDVIFVTGYLGDSYAGYKVLKQKTRSKANGMEFWAVRRHLVPVPRYAESRILAESGFVTSCMDISDGIVSDIRQIMGESSKGAQISADLLPVSYSGAAIAEKLNDNVEDYALYGGEDYELLFTVQKKNKNKLMNMVMKYGIPVFEVGRITAKKELCILSNGKRKKEVSKKVWKHF